MTGLGAHTNHSLIDRPLNVEHCVFSAHSEKSLIRMDFGHFFRETASFRGFGATLQNWGFLSRPSRPFTAILQKLLLQKA